jgi:hypothetical protein
MRSVVDRNAVMRCMIIVSVLSVTDSVHTMTSDGGGGGGGGKGDIRRGGGGGGRGCGIYIT